jgi:hypothetical protein
MWWCWWLSGLSFFDRRSHRKKVNALHSLRNIRQAARNSVRSKQTRKERVPWAYWILRVVAIGSAVYRDKRIGTRTNESSDHNRYDLHTLSRLVWWKTELLLRLCTARLPYLQPNISFAGLDTGINITLRMELFPMHDSEYFDEKEISWKRESNVILCFLPSTLILYHKYFWSDALWK